MWSGLAEWPNLIDLATLAVTAYIALIAHGFSRKMQNVEEIRSTTSRWQEFNQQVILSEEFRTTYESFRNGDSRIEDDMKARAMAHYILNNLEVGFHTYEALGAHSDAYRLTAVSSLTKSRPMARAFLALLTDGEGYDRRFRGFCRGIILRRYPEEGCHGR